MNRFTIRNTVYLQVVMYRRQFLGFSVIDVAGRGKMDSFGIVVLLDAVRLGRFVLALVALPATA